MPFDIVYDPRNVSAVYIPRPDGSGYVLAELADPIDRFQGKRFEDVQDQMYVEMVETKRRKGVDRQTAAEHNEEIRHIVHEGLAKTRDALDPGTSDAARVRDIRPARAKEKAERRRDEAFTPRADNTPKQGAKVVPLHGGRDAVAAPEDDAALFQYILDADEPEEDES